MKNIYECLLSLVTHKGELHLDEPKTKALLSWFKVYIEDRTDLGKLIHDLHSKLTPKSGSSRIRQIKALLGEDESIKDPILRMDGEARRALVEELDTLECQYDDLEERELESQSTGPSDE